MVPDRPSLPVEDLALTLYSPRNSPPLPSACPFSNSASPSPAMSSAASHWGTLINPDKSPAPLLEQLCLGIAQLMPSFDNNGTTDLTPERLAAFYRKVGGNYDPLFLETKTQALSFIYQSLGCFHSLQPTTNPYEAPSIPSLLPNGFVRWQTIQLLMDPDEHWEYLRNAVSQWDIVDAKGEVFPKDIPRDAFPSEPDPEMLQWHEGVSRRLEYDYVKRNMHRAPPTNFEPYHDHFSGKDPSPDEEEFVYSPHGSGSRHHSHYDSDRSSQRRHHHHHRRLSAEYPPSGYRRHEAGFVPRPDGGRSGFASPRSSSPSAFAERPRRSRGRDRASWYGHPLSPDVDDAPDAPNVSDHSPRDEDHDRKLRRRSHHHNLSPPSHSRARRHSHDAYTRKPARDLSPAPPRYRNDDYDLRSPKSSKSREKTRPSDDRSRSRPAGVKFRDFIFDGPVPAPAPDPTPYVSPPPPPPPPPRAVPRHRYNLDSDDTRRGSYSGGSTGGSRPGSGGSGSERPRSFSSAGYHSRSSRWTSPVRSSAAKRYVPTSVAEDAPYIPSTSRRAPIYD